jgi:small subunit ribosomal protein S17
MFPDHEQHLVHDPNNSLVTGDVIELHRLKVSRRVEHVVASIVSPFGDPIESRPPIPTADERLAKYKEYRFKKLLRREKRARAAEGDAEAVQELKNMGLEPGAEAEAAVRRKDAELKAAEKSEGSTEGVVLAEDREALEGGAAQGRRSKPERKTVEQKREERRLLRERAAEQMEVEAK